MLEKQKFQHLVVIECIQKLNHCTLFHSFLTLPFAFHLHIYLEEKEAQEGQIRWKYVRSALFFMSQLQGRSEKCSSKATQQSLPMQHTLEKRLWRTSDFFMIFYNIKKLIKCRLIWNRTNQFKTTTYYNKSIKNPEEEKCQGWAFWYFIQQKKNLFVNCYAMCFVDSLFKNDFHL